MKITVALAVIIAASLSVQGAMAQDQASTPNSAATGSIEGVALQTDTNEPIAGSNVTLSSPWLSVRSRQTKTDDQGKFSFTGLEAGTYGLSFSGLPYVRQAYGQKTFPGSGMALVLTNGQSIKALVMHLMRTGAMTGRVQDPAGKPLSAIPVHILKSVYDANGKRTFQDSGKTTTDDRGVYRIYGITPGHYYAAAGGVISGVNAIDAFYQPPLISPNEVPEARAITFYPRSGDAAGASSIEILPGGDYTGVDFVLEPQVLYRVRGHAIDIRTGKPPADATVRINRAPLSGETTQEIGNYTASTGFVEAAGLAPGTYAIGVATDALTARGGSYLNVTVGNSDIENIVWTLSPASTLKGRFIVDGLTPTSWPKIEFGLQPVIPEMIPQGELLDNSGAFAITNVIPGDYRVEIHGVSPYYVKSIRYGGGEILGKTLQYSAGDTAPLEIVLSPFGAEAQGTVLDGRNNPMPGNTVVLVPERAKDRTDLYRRTTADAAGHFSFSNVPPGDYRIYAWEALEMFAFFDPEVTRAAASKATFVQLQESSKASVTVTLIPAAP